MDCTRLALTFVATSGLWSGALSAAAAGPDFDGDGYADLAIGVPFERVSGKNTAGAVNVIYGSQSGLASAGNQLWHEDREGVVDAAEKGDQFGHSPAWGDFNGDGFDDLAVGAPFENVENISDAGQVHVFYGSAAGLTADADQRWQQNKANVEDVAEAGDYYGFALASADFNGDGYADLAVGAPGENIRVGPLDIANAGAVGVLYGSADGLVAGDSDQFWHQDSAGVLDQVENGDDFGYALACGDFDGDGFADLAISIPDESVNGIANAGAVAVLHGSASGLHAANNQFWHQDSSPGVPEINEASDTFGYAMAAGDFNGDGKSDLAISIPFEKIGALNIAGAAVVLYGSSIGLTDFMSSLWTQNDLGVGETVESGDLFGWAMSAADFDGDGLDDLAISAPMESVAAIGQAGAVFVLPGSPLGLTTLNAQIWHQDSNAVLDAAEAQDLFGYTVTAGDFDGDGRSDLAIGVPFENIGSIADAGAMAVIYGSLSGLDAAGNQRWSQDSPGIRESCEANEAFSFGNHF